jgi:hypothetical protein
MKVGSFTQEEEPNRNRFTGRTGLSRKAGTDCDERDRPFFLAHSCASTGRILALSFASSKGMDINADDEVNGNKYWMLHESERAFVRIGSECRGANNETR